MDSDGGWRGVWKYGRRAGRPGPDRGGAGEMTQKRPRPENGMLGQGISPREISSPACGPVEANSAAACVYCWQPLGEMRRGRPAKFHPACRRAFDREARRIGGKNLRRRLARARKPRAPRPKRAVPRLSLAQYEDLRAFIARAAGWW